MKQNRGNNCQFIAEYFQGVTPLIITSTLAIKLKIQDMRAQKSLLLLHQNRQNFTVQSSVCVVLLYLDSVT